MYSIPMEHLYRGRGALANPDGRFLRHQTEPLDDGWYQEALSDSIATQVRPEAARTVISRNDSPDIPYEQSINPYRGCEHGCIYCYARPSHAYLDLSPGVDFETRLFYKADAAALLRAELASPAYRCKPIMLGANTDPYQPIEKRLGVTRSLLEVLSETAHPVMLLTKGALILRDLDLLRSLAERNLVWAMVTLTTLDANLKRTLEPRAASAEARLRVLGQLSAAGIPCGVMAAPMIPAVNDAELEQILERATAAGASQAGYVLLRLPGEVAGLFRQWLDQHLPDRAAHVMSLLQSARGGRDNDPRFGHRMRGNGAWAQLLRDRFKLTCRRLGLNRYPGPQPRTDLFRPPSAHGQLSLSI
ncbi:MAG TPA: PA0069 family radical SAM protein [Steroidobacteraceae bacterium]|nr:PA0069 family radical SAM protein [Steroidobacteraceae bacterium]